MRFVYCMHIVPTMYEETGSESERSSIDSCTEASEGESAEQVQESNNDASPPVEHHAVECSDMR